MLVSSSLFSWLINLPFDQSTKGLKTTSMNHPSIDWSLSKNFRTFRLFREPGESGHGHPIAARFISGFILDVLLRDDQVLQAGKGRWPIFWNCLFLTYARIQLDPRNFGQHKNIFNMGSGWGSVGWAVASNTRDQWFKPGLQDNIIYQLYNRKDKNK